MNNYDVAAAEDVNEPAATPAVNKPITSADTSNSLSVAAPTPAPRDHNYDFKDGSLYGYLGAVSEDDQKRGVATPPVIRFRYTGFWDGAHHLQWVGDNGAVLGLDECPVPCVAIRTTDASGSVRLIGYTRDSIVGAAFEDAMDGRLKRDPAPGSITNGYRFLGGNPNIPSNWQALFPPPSSAPSISADEIRVTERPAENEAATNNF